MKKNHQKSGVMDLARGHFTRLAVLAALSMGLLAPVALCAQESKPWEKIPVPPLRAFNPHQPKRIELKNGIVLFLQEDHELPFVTGSVLLQGARAMRIRQRPD